MSAQQRLIFIKRNFDIFSLTIIWITSIFTLGSIVEGSLQINTTIPCSLLTHLCIVFIVSYIIYLIISQNKLIPTEEIEIKNSCLFKLSEIPITKEGFKTFYLGNTQPNIHKYMDIVVDKLSKVTEEYRKFYNFIFTHPSLSFITRRFYLIENCIREHLIEEGKIKDSIPLENYHIYHYYLNDTLALAIYNFDKIKSLNS